MKNTLLSPALIVIVLLASAAFVVISIAYTIENVQDNLPGNLGAGENLVGYWKFDDNAGGIATDNSGGGNNGTIYGTALADGKFDNAFHFNGTSDYVEVPNNPSLEFDELTWVAWVKMDAMNVTNGILSKSFVGDVVGEWGGFVSGADTEITADTAPYRAKFFASTSSGRSTIYGETNLSTGNWYHLAGTYDGAKIRIYVNGVKDGETALSGALHVDMPLWIGRGAKLFYLSGALDEVRLYNYALSDSEIQQLVMAVPI